MRNENNFVHKVDNMYSWLVSITLHKTEMKGFLFL